MSYALAESVNWNPDFMKPETEQQQTESALAPCPGYANGGAELTVRDEIAIALLPGIISTDDGGTVADAAKELGIQATEYVARKHWPILAAIRAYEAADALLAVRSGRHSHTS